MNLVGLDSDASGVLASVGTWDNSDAVEASLSSIQKSGSEDGSDSGVSCDS